MSSGDQASNQGQAETEGGYSVTAANIRARLHVEQALQTGSPVQLDAGPTHYLRNVLRCKDKERVSLFNNRSGEFTAEITKIGKKATDLVLVEQTREPEPALDLWLLFAPIKRDRMDYMVQKASEMGAGRLFPVMTRFTQGGKINLQRLQANAIEAAEQCGRLHVAEIEPLQDMMTCLSDWPVDRRLIFCDETAGLGEGLDRLADLQGEKLAILIGPEGGFSEEEKSRLRAIEACSPISLGPRVLRADTAMVAALALVQSCIGDWNES